MNILLTHTQFFNVYSIAMNNKKYHRRTVVVTKRDGESPFAVFIREMSFINGGVGCAIWDGAIILSRWLFEHEELVKDKEVLELGAGVGLPGIVCSKFAKRTVLTDYVPHLLCNLVYNIWLNSHPLEDKEEADDVYDGLPYDVNTLWNSRKEGEANMRNCYVSHLDWFNDKYDGEAPEEIEVPDVPKGIKGYMSKLGGEEDKFDLIIGSEIIYLDRDYTELADLIERRLKPNGVVVICLSTDRAGQDGWRKLMESRGFCVERQFPPEYMLGSYGSHQRPENYSIYLHTRK